MKLLRLKLNVPFRSLSAGFEIYFLREWDYGRCFEFHPCCLAGRNGSGKSNVLEVLASIFYHMECTSHSPFIISDCQTENVLVFEKNGDGRVESHNPDSIPLVPPPTPSP